VPPVTPRLSRRALLTGAAGAGGAALLSGCSTPLGPALLGTAPTAADVVFWHLFGGGDGENMATMVGDVEQQTGRTVESTLLSWGNPYYTKLSLSTSSGRGPDVAVAHLSRLPLLARAGLITPLDEVGAADAGITEDKFTPAAWQKATIDGTTYAAPLDTHPFVLFYNTDLAEKAGLLDGDGGLVELDGSDAFVAALQAMKDAGAEYGAVSSNVTDPSTTWRWFMTVYSGLAGPLVSDLGTRVTIDPDAAEQAFAFIQSLTGDLGLMPPSATPGTVSTLFGQGKAGFLLDGVWQIPTYRDVSLPNGDPLPFDVRPFPALLGDDPVSYADSHALVFPISRDRDATRTAHSLDLVVGLLEDSAVWADGGHVPAWLPTQQSQAFQQLEPQNRYVQAAFDAVYDPPGWYTGAGSDFQNSMGGVISTVLGGRISPAQAVDQMTDSLETYAAALSPVE
jgi:multiple sugar transport system substrate-binding protein